MGWKKKAAEYRRQYYTLAENGHRQVKEEIVRTTITIMLLNQSLSGSVHRQRGIARHSLTYTALAESNPGLYSDDIIMFTATQVYTGEHPSVRCSTFQDSGAHGKSRWQRYGNSDFKRTHNYLLTVS